MWNISYSVILDQKKLLKKHVTFFREFAMFQHLNKIQQFLLISVFSYITFNITQAFCQPLSGI